MKHEKIIIFGTGKAGVRAYKTLQKKCNIIGFSDNDKSIQGKALMNIPVLPPHEIPKHNVGKIIIASQYYPTIHRQLTAMGISKNNIEVMDPQITLGLGNVSKLFIGSIATIGFSIAILVLKIIKHALN